MDPYAGLPALGRSFVIAIWLEAIIYGMNCILFSSTMYILLRRSKINRFLFASSSVLFSLSTAHVAMSLRQTLNAFTDPTVTAIPRGSDIYFAVSSTPLALAQYTVYVVNITCQDILLIWRLYVVWGNNWKICMVPLVVEVIHNGCAFGSIALLANPNILLLTSMKVHALALAAWASNLVLYIGLTVAIAYRLWWANRRVNRLYAGRGRYTPALLTVVESGAVFATATVISLSLAAAWNPAVVAAMAPTTQLATTVPLVILVRAGLDLRSKGPPSTGLQSTLGNTILNPEGRGQRTEVAVAKLQGSRFEYSMDGLPAKMPHLAQDV